MESESERKGPHDEPDKGDVSPDEPRRSGRQNSPTWRRVEAAGKVYFAICKQLARAVSALDR